MVSFWVIITVRQMDKIHRESSFSRHALYIFVELAHEPRESHLIFGALTATPGDISIFLNSGPGGKSSRDTVAKSHSEVNVRWIELSNVIRWSCGSLIGWAIEF